MSAFKVKRYHFESIDSTNNWVKRQEGPWPEDRLVVVSATRQAAGRGRQGHSWFSPVGASLYVSFGIDVVALPTGAAPWQTHLGQIAAVAAVEAIGQATRGGCQVQLKWPNDLLYRNKKVGGILCEIVAQQGWQRLAIGFGINIGISKEALAAAGLAEKATALPYGEQLPEAFREKLLEALLTSFSAFYGECRSLGFDALWPLYRGALRHKIGERITFHQQGRLIDGLFAGLTAQGELRLKDAQGRILQFCCGQLD